MSIVNARYIFCEGEAGGPDILLWSRILIGEARAHIRVVITPMGGKQGGNSFARGYQQAKFNQDTKSNQDWFVIRDRDLDAEPKDHQTVIKLAEKVLLTGLTCLESYFLSPDLLQAYIQTLPSPPTNLPTDHQETLQATLHKLRDYQAVRWALQRVRDRIKKHVDQMKLYRAGGQFDLPNRLTDDDGKLPQQLSLESCRDEAEKLCQQFSDISKSVDLTFLTDSINELRSLFDGDNFWSHEYKKWFHGKDVLRYWLRAYPNINHGEYCKWAAQHVDWKSYPDLIEIQKICLS